MANRRSIGNLLKNNFADAARSEMDAAHDLKFAAEDRVALSDEDLRAKLRKAFLGSQHPGASEPTPRNLALGNLNKVPNLRSTGQWDGRMRLVTFNQQHGSPLQEVQPVGWDGVIWNIPLGQAVQMPYPYWRSAQNTLSTDHGSDAVTQWEKTRDGRLVKVTTPKTTPTLNYVDHGDVPGTEDLPEDYVDFFQREAKRTNLFKGYKRPVLFGIYNTLMPPLPMSAFRDMSDDDIRVDIAQTLGTEYVTMLQNEMYAEAG